VNKDNTRIDSSILEVTDKGAHLTLTGGVSEGEIKFELNGESGPVLHLKPSGEILVRGNPVATDIEVYNGLKDWLTGVQDKEADQPEPEAGPRLAYVFDMIEDRQPLKDFETYLAKEYDVLADDAQPEGEPQVIYMFRAFRDRYELAEFQRGPNYGRALDSFGNWLRAQYRYQSESLTDKESALLEKVWEQWCGTLEDEDAVAD